MDLKLAFGIFFFGCLIIAVIFCYAITVSKNETNSCDCSDVNQCEKWCNAKINYIIDNNNYHIIEDCLHPEILTQVLESSGTCETTIEVCADCNEPLTEPKTDCR